MKRLLISLVALSLLSACSKDKPTTEEVPKQAVKKEQETPKPVVSTLTTSEDKSFSLSVLNGYHLDTEEPGADVILPTNDDQTSMKIETTENEDIESIVAERAKAIDENAKKDENTTHKINGAIVYEAHPNGENVYVIGNQQRVFTIFAGKTKDRELPYIEMAQTIKFVAAPAKSAPVETNKNRPDTETITFLQNDTTKQEVASLYKSPEQPYSMYVLPNYTGDAVEPGKDIILHQTNDAISMMVELFDDNSDIKLLQADSMEYVKASSKDGTISDGTFEQGWLTGIPWNRADTGTGMVLTYVVAAHDTYPTMRLTLSYSYDVKWPYDMIEMSRTIMRNK